jgi:hypothetical protein
VNRSSDLVGLVQVPSTAGESSGSGDLAMRGTENLSVIGVSGAMSIAFGDGEIDVSTSGTVEIAVRAVGLFGLGPLCRVTPTTTTATTTSAATPM